MKERIEQLDFLKGVLILQVIMIHLVYLGQCHPTFKQFLLLYTTPAFFIISGYLAHFNKPKKLFAKKIYWWIVPYTIMETAYIIMASILPIKEHIEHLEIQVLFYYLCLKPLGPYWYIHDLIICYLAYYLIIKSVHNVKFKIWSTMGALAILPILLSLHMISLQTCLFFTIGVCMRGLNIHVLSFFRSSWLSILLAISAFHFHTQVNITALTKSIILTYIMICFLITINSYLPTKVKNIINIVGRNTFAILLFSPMFTILTKQFVRFFAFDPTTILFTLTSVIFTTSGCLVVAYLTDKCKISRYICGSNFLQN